MTHKKLTKIPKSVDILGLKIPITMCSDMVDAGQYLGMEKLIKLNLGQPREDFEPTLLHEMGHAALARVEVTFLTENEEDIIVENIMKVVIENYNLTPKNRKCFSFRK